MAIANRLMKRLQKMPPGRVEPEFRKNCWLARLPNVRILLHRNRLLHTLAETKDVLMSICGTMMRIMPRGGWWRNSLHPVMFFVQAGLERQIALQLS
ncbi:MAG: hypothetical protein IT476_02945, partial [Rhodanobacteraceae bacterium]|nr:hypothetical protein [Rhodanobacteraceae bacterium]